MMDDQFTLTQTAIPYSKQAEEALLGAAVIDPSILTLIEIEPDNFYVHKHRWVWKALIDLSRDDITPDMVTLSELLERRKQLGEIGGQAYLASLVNNTPSTLGAEHYARIVKEDAKRRTTITVANNLARAAYDKKSSIDETVMASVDALTSEVRPRHGLQHISHFLEQVYDEVSERAKNPMDIWGIPTGFIDLDRLLGGLQKSEVFIIGGVPGIGKSKLVNQVAVQTAEANYATALFSLEMRGISVARRMLSARSKVITRKMKTGRMESDDWVNLNTGYEKMSDIPLYLSEQSGLTLLEFRSDIARFKAKYDIQVVVLDYLLLMGGFPGMDDTERSAQLSAGIKNIANEYDVALITVSSVTKDLMGGGNPMNKQMRGSGQVIHDADVIAFLTEHLPDKDNGEQKDNNMVTLSFTKGREMDSGLFSIDLLCHSGYPLFSDVVVREVNPLLVQEENDNGRERWGWSDT